MNTYASYRDSTLHPSTRKKRTPASKPSRVLLSRGWILRKLTFRIRVSASYRLYTKQWYDLILAIRIGRLTRPILPAPLVASLILWLSAQNTQSFASDEPFPLARLRCPYNLLSQYVFSVAPAFCVIDKTLEGSLIESELVATQNGHLQNSRSPLLGDIGGSVDILGDRVCNESWKRMRSAAFSVASRWRLSPMNLVLR